MRHITLTEGPDLPADVSPDAHPGLAAPTEAMDARIHVHNTHGRPTAWAALWWKHTPTWPDGSSPLAAIGGFGAHDASSATTLLAAATDHLRKLGAIHIVGPINGNTWRSYRFVVESTAHAPFLLEPRNPPEYPAWWRAAGFSELAGYSSSRVPLDGRSTLTPSLRLKITDSGVTLRDLDATRYDEELAAIHTLTLAGFANNFLYTPLPKDAFIAAYQKVRHLVQPEFIRIAERNGRPCGYVFAIPDHEATARGEQPALIIKTLTVDPAARCPGLGSLLVDDVQLRAHQSGHHHAIHALQFETNTSLRITARNGGTRIRRYALLSMGCMTKKL